MTREEAKRQLGEEMLSFLEESNKIEREPGLDDESIMAMTWAIDNQDRMHDVVYALEIHRILMLKKDPNIAGKPRDCVVWIGGEAKPNPGPEVIRSKLRDWCEESASLLRIIEGSIKNNRHAQGMWDSEKKENVCKAIHVDFEKLHPFRDGNGRTGRILWQVHRMHLGLPVKVIKADWPKSAKKGGEQASYYNWFKENKK